MCVIGRTNRPAAHCIVCATNLHSRTHHVKRHSRDYMAPVWQGASMLDCGKGGARARQDSRNFSFGNGADSGTALQ